MREEGEPVAKLRRIFELVKTDLLPLVESLPTREESDAALGEYIRGELTPED